MSGRFRKELAQGYRLTTNNRMELLAVIIALESIKGSGHEVTLYSDSKYVIDAITKNWVFGWYKKGFKGKKNADLWRRYLQVHSKNPVRFQWVKGHANIPENERCDFLAVQAAKGKQHLIDQGYEAENKGMF